MIFCTAAAFYLVATGLLGKAAEYDPFEAAVPVVRFSFEEDEDLDFDQQPDDWTRRKGPAFPAYVEAEIDRNYGRNGGRSLRFDVNGGQAVLYSPPKPIDASHSYVFQGFLRTERLEHDAAVISVSFLNHKRQRIQRFVSPPVSGTHADWQRVRIGPITPHADVSFVVVGCHLVTGKRMDIRGRVWFDDLWLGRLPQLTLLSNFNMHFKERSAPIEITSQVGGLDPGYGYRLHLRLIDSSDRIVAETTRVLEADAADTPLRQEAGPPEGTDRRMPEVWELEPQEYGFYRVQSMLERDGMIILDEQTSFGVMDRVETIERGGFGWSVSMGRGSRLPSERQSSSLSTHGQAGSLPYGGGMAIRELADVAAQAGINWLKFPLWESAFTEDKQLSAEIGELLERLNRQGITPVGVLSDPPPELRRKFAGDWSGVSEIFTMPPAFWSPSLEPVIARYSSQVRHWQLGGESDGSFVGMNRLGATLATVKRAFDRIGRDTHVGVAWDWDTPFPARSEIPRTFLSLNSAQESALLDKLRETQAAGVPRWVVLKPLAKSKHVPEERGADLVKRMVAAKIGGAEAIFAYDVFDSEHGLLNPNGSPTLLFLPWRSTALALQGAEFLGSLNMPNGSRNFVFAREGEVVLFVWNDEPVVEEMYLGEKVTTMDVWGVQRPVRREAETGWQRLEVGPTPLIVRGCSEPIARWSLAVQFDKGRLRSETGEQSEAIRGVNTFPQGTSGTVTLVVPHEWGWKVEPNVWQRSMAAGETFELPMNVTLPSIASLGTDRLAIDFEVAADRPYKFRVYRPYQVGLGDLTLEVLDRKDEDGRLEIEQIIVNNTSPEEILNFRCSLFVPGSRRQKKLVTKLGNGQDKKFYYLPNADELRGKELWLRAEEVRGRRVLNYKWTVGQNWDKPPESTARRSATLGSR